ncbi:MAG: MBL fold metallo-hydrolase [Actinomycetota bacterium]|jgi:ribonuclease BN (tRNA processing enzyme)|nr:MBL fold metallo-hydrolase [Actinomycetota bacterium]
MARIEFFGVRGSHPTPTLENLRFGGNTSCVVLYSDADPDGRFPVILDLGTGLTKFGACQPLDGSFRGTALLSHLHFDHIQGLPFFSPIDRKGARLLIYGPSENGKLLNESLGTLIAPPFFPVTLSDLSGEIIIGDLDGPEIVLEQPGEPKVFPQLVEHTNATFGYRIELDGKVIVYIPDHQAPSDGLTIKESVLDLCSGADILIHDAQYTQREFREKSHWGHSTYDYAVEIASRAEVKVLTFFHHDPCRTDEQLEEMERHFQSGNSISALHIFAAREGALIKI